VGLFYAFHQVAQRSARHRRGDEGISLVEVMVAFTILLITVLPLTYLLTSAVSSAANSRQRVAALQLADSWLEVLSNTTLPTNSSGAIVTNTPTDPSTFQGITATSTQIPKSPLAGTAFAVTAEFTTQSVSNQGQSDLCSSGQPPSPSHPAVILLQVKVSWNHGNNSVTDTTAVNYPQPGLQTQGFLAVQLSNSGSLDVNGNNPSDRLQAVPVSLTETSQTNATDPWVASNSTHTLTLYPDENGCVFAQVPTGNYSVAVAQPSSGQPQTFTGYSGTPPFVNTTGGTTDTGSTLVTVTAESTVQLDAFDEGITTAVSYGSSSAVGGGVACPGTTSIMCVATGNGTTGATASWGGTGSNWSSNSFSAISKINQVACTTAASPTCVGVGTNTSGGGTGIIRTTSSDLGTTSSDTVPTLPGAVTDITQVTCPSANGCYALGTTSSGAVLLAGVVGQATDRWTEVAPLLTAFPSLSSIACPITSPTPTCEVTGTASVGLGAATPVILRLDGDPATLATNPLWAPAFTTDTLPSAVKSVGKITCPTATLCEATGVGDGTSATDATVVTAAIVATPATPPTPPSVWSLESTFPTLAQSIADISCTSSTCVAVGRASGATAVWTADLTQGPHDWSVATTLPTTTLGVSSVACGVPGSGDTADCVIAANTPNLSATGQLLEGSLSGGSWVWNYINPPSGSTVRSYVGVACQSAPSASRATCAAVGTTATGPIILTAANGPSGSWSVRTPSSLPGSLVTGIPLETAATPLNWTTQVAAGQASNATTLPNILYPQPNGYTIAAGDCLAEAISPAQATFSAVPGGAASTTVPLGMLPLKLVTTAGVPVTGATIKIKAVTAGCSNDVYTLPATDAYGLTQTSVPYGTYSYTVTASNGTVTSPSATLAYITTSKVVSGATTTYLPGPVVVTST
jgi:Tfp pilus assembly protein PilV